MLGIFFALAVCTTTASSTDQWARQPGERVRDVFSPIGGSCRGACGPGCPTASCEATVTYECASPDRLRRVRTFSCGTHQACRQHDDCLDRCRQRQGQGFDCDAVCHTEVVEQYGVDRATSWIRGGGPFDDQRITFEYTRDAPDGPEPLFRCPDGASLSCGAGAGRCVTGASAEVTPVFDAYAGGARGMQVSGFRSGRVCGSGGSQSSVCEETVDVAVTGERAWYGFEFDYRNADPSAPLQCSASGAEDDFLGGLVKNLATVMPADRSTELGALFGQIQNELGRGRSLTDVLSGISVRPAGEPAPVESAAATAKPGVPSSVPMLSASGHMVVPMFELGSGGAPGSVTVREVRCTHKGSPVLETTFRLRFGGR
jgi:hypothetical protein